MNSAALPSVTNKRSDYGNYLPTFQLPEHRHQKGWKRQPQLNGGGAAIFGTRPQPIAMPNPYGDLQQIYPDLGETNAQLSSDVLSRLRGELSPDTLNALRDNAAAFGVSSGMPGSGLSANRGLRNLGLATEDVQRQGLQDYNALMPVLSSTQTVRPETQADINTQNSVWRSAPDPAAAGNYAQQLFDRYLAAMSSPAGARVDHATSW